MLLSLTLFRTVPVRTSTFFGYARAAPDSMILMIQRTLDSEVSGKFDFGGTYGELPKVDCIP
jgi:hypothetical protein